MLCFSDHVHPITCETIHLCETFGINYETRANSYVKPMHVKHIKHMTKQASLITVHKHTFIIYNTDLGELMDKIFSVSA